MDINKPPIPLNIKLKALALITLIIASGFFDIVFPISFVSSIFILYGSDFYTPRSCFLFKLG